MDIIFGYVNFWTFPLIKILKYLRFNVYYLFIDFDNEIKKNKLAKKLEINNILPVPFELEKKISSNASFSLCESDPNEVAYNKNETLVSDKILSKYCSLFSVDKIKKLRILVQDIIFFQQIRVSGKLDVWSAIHPKRKILYVSFKFKCFYNLGNNKNIFKIIIPLDVFNFFIKIIKKNTKVKQETSTQNHKNINDFMNKKVAFIPHKGISYGEKESKLYEKSLYYSADKNSNFSKNDILHLDYSNYPQPKENICWLSFESITFSKYTVYLKTILFSIRKIYLIRSWSTFLVWIFFIHQYNKYLIYFYKIKKFKNLKLAILDYEILCPKTLVLALQNNNVHTAATQERFIHTFYTSYANLIVDTYFTISEFSAKLIKKSKYHDIKNIIAAGSYRNNLFSDFKNYIPNEIADAKKKGKKIIVLLGYPSANNWFESYTSLQCSWLSQISFLEDAIKLAKSFDNSFLIIKYKSEKCPIRSNPYFKNILKKISECENLILASDYKQSFYAYKLCNNADLVIAKHTSIGDECLIQGIPTLFYEYTHNMKGLQSDAFNYSPSKIMCYDFDELLENSKSLLFNKESNLKSEIIKLKQTIYYVSDTKDIKKNIIAKLENMIIEKK